jgi:hypothetical protein
MVGMPARDAPVRALLLSQRLLVPSQGQVFGYAAGNPISFVDPEGLTPLALPWCGPVLTALGKALVTFVATLAAAAAGDEVGKWASEEAREACKGACVEAYEAAYDLCSRTRPSPREQALCYAEVAEDLVDCLKGCG